MLYVRIKHIWARLRVRRGMKLRQLKMVTWRQGRETEPPLVDFNQPKRTAVGPSFWGDAVLAMRADKASVSVLPLQIRNPAHPAMKLTHHVETERAREAICP